MGKTEDKKYFEDHDVEGRIIFIKRT